MGGRGSGGVRNSTSNTITEKDLNDIRTWRGDSYMVARFQKAAKKGEQALAKEVEEVRRSYVSSGYPKGNVERMIDEALSASKNIETLIDNSSMPYRGMIYRGVQLSKSDLDKILKSSDDSPVDLRDVTTSWTSRMDVAQGFAQHQGAVKSNGSNKVVLVYDNSSNSIKTMDLSSFYRGSHQEFNDREVIVSGRTRLKYASSEKKNGITYIHLESIENKQRKR